MLSLVTGHGAVILSAVAVVVAAGDKVLHLLGLSKAASVADEVEAVLAKLGIKAPDDAPKA